MCVQHWLSQLKNNNNNYNKKQRGKCELVQFFLIDIFADQPFAPLCCIGRVRKRKIKWVRKSKLSQGENFQWIHVISNYNCMGETK